MILSTVQTKTPCFLRASYRSSVPKGNSVVYANFLSNFMVVFLLYLLPSFLSSFSSYLCIFMYSPIFHFPKLSLSFLFLLLSFTVICSFSISLFSSLLNRLLICFFLCTPLLTLHYTEKLLYWLGSLNKICVFYLTNI